MSERRNPDQDGLEAALEAFVGSQTGTADGACPDANALASYATGTALAAEREHLETHLLACRACRAAVATAARRPAAAKAPARFERKPRLRARHAIAGIAAVAALLLIGWLLAYSKSDTRGTPSTEELLTQHLTALAKVDPAAFGSIRALTRSERLARGDALQRGGIVLDAPVGTILDPRPRITWRGGRPATVVLSTADGRRLSEAEGATSPLEWPAEASPLERGASYLIELEVDGVLGPERASRTFILATEEALRLHAQRVEAVKISIEEPLQSLVLAHVALRGGFLAEARLQAEAYTAARPDDVVGRETLYQVLTRIGDPSASAVLETR